MSNEDLNEKSQLNNMVICSYCKIPSKLVIVPLNNDEYICERCINNSVIINEIKSNNKLQYNEINNKYNEISKRLFGSLTDKEMEALLLIKDIKDSESDKYFLENLDKFIV